jgi:hypothetical protein
MSKEHYHFTIDVIMDSSNVDAMVKAEWDAEDWGEEWPVWVAAHGFTQCWKDNYAVKMEVEQVSMTGDQRNTLTSLGSIPEDMLE